MEKQISDLNMLLSKSKRIVALTGAGISTSSGIPDFRGPNGLYSRKEIPAELLFDIDYFRKDPSLFYSHIGELWDLFMKAEPSIAHKSLSRLEQQGILSAVITQNIDGLHHKAGSRNVIPVHGDFESFFCIRCGFRTDDIQDIFSLVARKEIPRCSCGGVMKPNVIFFGEPVFGMDAAVEFVKRADLMMVIGSSLVVFPAASLTQYRSDTCSLVILNKGETPDDRKAVLKIDEDIDSVFSQLVF
jgi:NAD-dependent deacetylase